MPQDAALPSFALDHCLGLEEGHWRVFGGIARGGAGRKALHRVVGCGVEEEGQAVAIAATHVDRIVTGGWNPVVGPLPQQLPGVHNDCVSQGGHRHPPSVWHCNAEPACPILGEQREEGGVGVGSDAKLPGL
eukprot:CAMPEP_0117678826 /NCGR_PEP_ID=MMETSP0804-20121206/17501_1 /TAXON_ID=1074897 /ORGANISM="Tetraselmis astigmatica, Strain CCMP880" /LENGTH=131 /DNA_ID=CAMNT_0005488233 /DNA_START=82 /DNA_END=477 /DNA_ORIENTATION=+